MLYLLLVAAGSPAIFEDMNVLDERIRAVAPGAGATDKRLKLAKCPADPAIAPPVGGAVIVRCLELGWRLRIALTPPAGSFVSTEIIVRKGDVVECISDGHGFSVSAMMVALDHAAAGQPVRVKSPTSPMVITATAKARGIVSF